MDRHLWRFALTVMLTSGVASALAGPADRFANVKVEATPVAGSVFMLTGAGGNIAASVGPDGTLVVDNQYNSLGPRILAELKRIGGAMPRIVINTHHHSDHTGTNQFFGAQGTIVAHDRVRFRLQVAGVERAALPLVTYGDRLRLYFNDDDIDVLHLPAGHTDGDSIVWFRTAGVAHLGDHFFTERFPYVDVRSGGTVDGLLENLERVIEVLPADTRLIPGHGALSRMTDLAQYTDTIRAAKAEVLKRLQAGETPEAIGAAGLGPWESYGSGFVTTQRWAEIVRDSVATPENGAARERRE